MKNLAQQPPEGKVIRLSNSLRSPYKEINEASPLEAALMYAKKLKWYVFPVRWPVENGCSCGNANCNNIGKHPMIRDWESEATTDPRKIRRWWTRWPRANIGIAAGKSGVIVLDVDPDKGGRGSLQKLVQTHGRLPKTVRSKTGGGGAHFLFKEPSIRIGCRVGFRPGLDIRGHGGFIIAAPSVHETWNKYQWIRGGKPAEMPEWLLKLLTERTRDDAVSGAGIDPSDILTGLITGERDDKLFRWLCRLVRRPTQKDLEAIAIMVQERASQEGHPFTEEDALAKARQAYNYTSEDEPEIVLEDGLEIWNCDDPEPEWIFENFLKEGCAVLAGPAKAGKSWIALEMCLSICLNRKCFGEFVPAQQGEVLYIDLEDSKTNTKGRLRLLLNEKEDPNLKKLLIHRKWAQVKLAVNRLDEFLSEHPDVKMVVIDTLVGIRKSRSKNQDLLDYDYKVIAGFRGLADRHRIAIVIIHHFNKAQIVSDVFDRISGSTGIQAAPHTLIAYGSRRGERGGIVQVTGRRSPDVKFALKRDSNERPLWEDAEEFEMTKERLEIKLQLEQVYPETLSRADLAELVGVKKGTVSKRLAVMYRDGQIDRTGQGNQTRYKAKMRRNTDQLREDDAEEQK